ncbi:hypothetical protein HK104_002709 [Borealophlyctis nickersoniae]|nr:hypothetical protein HK104_002709 [Borealophlyctis nickersoniae]
MTSDPDNPVQEPESTLDRPTTPLASADVQRNERIIECLKELLPSFNPTRDGIPFINVLPLVSSLEERLGLVILTPSMQAGFEAGIQAMAADSPDARMSLNEICEFIRLALQNPNLKDISPGWARRLSTSFGRQTPTTPTSHRSLIGSSPFGADPRRKSFGSPTRSPSKNSRKSSSFMGFGVEAPSFSSNPSDDSFYSPAGNFGENDRFATRSPRSLRTDFLDASGLDFNTSNPMLGDATWSPRSSQRSDSSSNDSSPHKRLFRENADNFEAFGGASESEAEEVVRSDRANLRKRVEKLNLRLGDAEKAQKLADDRIHDLEQTITDLEMDLVNKRKENSDLRGKEKTLLTQIESLEASVMSLKRQLTSAKTNCTQLRQHLEHQTDMAERLTGTIRSRESELLSTQQNMELFELELNRANEEKAQLESDIKRLEMDLEMTDESVESLKSENADLKQIIDGLRANIEELERHQPAVKKETTLNGGRGHGHTPKSLKHELDSAYGSETGLDDRDFDERVARLLQSPRKLVDQNFFVDVTFPPRDTAEFAVQTITPTTSTSTQVVLDSRSLHCQTDAPPQARSSYAQTNEPAICKPAFSQTDFAPEAKNAGAQTDDDMKLWEAEMAATAELRKKCAELTLLLEEREQDGGFFWFLCNAVEQRGWEADAVVGFVEAQIAEAREAIQLLETQNAALKEQILGVQRQVLQTRRDLNIRKHYDAEADRWIRSLKDDVKNAEAEMKDTREALEAQMDEQTSLRTRIREVENAVTEHQTDSLKMALKDVGLRSEVITTSIATQTDASSDFGDDSTRGLDQDDDIRSTWPPTAVIPPEPTPSPSTLRRQFSRLCVYGMVALTSAAAVGLTTETSKDSELGTRLSPVESVLHWIDEWGAPDGRRVKIPV